MENELIRCCNHCKKPMSSGYVIEGGEEYYCSDVCLHTRFTPEEWADMYSDDWTEWESEYFDED